MPVAGGKRYACPCRWVGQAACRLVLGNSNVLAKCWNVLGVIARGEGCSAQAVACFGRALGHDLVSVESVAPLRSLRDVLYACVARRADALFEVVDALLASPPVLSLPHLSLAPLHRRG